MRRGCIKMRVGLTEFPSLVKERVQNPNISLKELRNEYGDLRILNSSSCLDIGIMRIFYPQFSLQQIGNNFNVSREMVRQYLNLMHLPTKAIRPSSYKFNCLNCGIKSKKKFCNIKCSSEYKRESVYCEVCGKEVKRLKSRIKWNIVKLNYKHTWCSRYCHGKWLGKHNGKGRKSCA